jgi:hypothetical protein
MKFVLTVTGITKVADDRLLVQLQGPYGHSQLNLPVSQQNGLMIGQEFHLAHETSRPFIGEINEVEERERRTLLSPPIAPLTMPSIPRTPPGIPKPPESR